FEESPGMGAIHERDYDNRPGSSQACFSGSTSFEPLVGPRTSPCDTSSGIAMAGQRAMKGRARLSALHNPKSKRRLRSCETPAWKKFAPRRPSIIRCRSAMQRYRLDRGSFPLRDSLKLCWPQNFTALRLSRQLATDDVPRSYPTTA